MTSTDQTSTESSPEVTKNPCEREVSVEVTADSVARAFKDVQARFQKHARVPGFRNGKVPMGIIRSKFADEIRSEVVERLVPPAFREATKKANFIPVSQPRVLELELEEDKPLRFKAAFEVLPEFTIEGYREIKAEVAPIEVNDEDVQKTLDGLREQNSTYVNMDEDRGLQDGDFASVAFRSTGMEEGSEPVEMKDALVEIGSKNTMPQFTENLRGAKAGESRSFDVTYPEDFGEKRLAGKTLHYEIDVKSIKLKSVPELDDEWVKELGQEGLATVEDLRARIRESIGHEKRHQAEHKAKDEVVRQLTEKFQIDVPNAMVESAIDRRLERGLRALAAQGVRGEDLKRMDFAGLRSGQREMAVRDVRANLLLGRIADMENIQVSEEELDKEIAAAARQSGQNPLTLRKELEEKDELESLRQQMRCDRALNWLYGNSSPDEKKD